MENIKKLLVELIQETYPSRRAMHVTPLDYRSGGGRGTGVPAASKFTSDTPQRTQLGRPPRPTPMHGQIGDPSVSGTDYMGSKLVQNSGDSYYIPDEYGVDSFSELGDEDTRVREKIRKLVNALLLDPENVSDDELEHMVAHQSTPSAASHLVDRDPSYDIDEGSDAADDDLDEDDTDEASSAGVGGVTVPIGAGPRYPNKSRRRKEPPSWYYYMKAVDGTVVDPQL